LFERWLVRRPGLAFDGVVDEGCYERSRPKLLFLLKEVSNPKRLERKPEGWDLRVFLYDGGIRVLWDNVARWVAALRADPPPPWSEVAFVSDERRANALRSIVAMNLKKAPGGGDADLNHIRQAATEDQTFLRSQYSLYEPDIVMCCGGGVRSLFSEIILQDDRHEWHPAAHGFRYADVGIGRWAIDFRHPQVRSSHERVYAELVDVLSDVRCAMKGLHNQRMQRTHSRVTPRA